MLQSDCYFITIRLRFCRGCGKCLLRV